LKPDEVNIQRRKGRQKRKVKKEVQHKIMGRLIDEEEKFEDGREWA